MDYSKLPTEKQNPKTAALDLLPVEKILHLMDAEDRRVPRAVARVNPQIAQAVKAVVKAVKSNGRVFFAGAGTSGRLGVIEAAECPPTFNTPPSLVQAVMAGGRPSVFRSKEGAEDREDEGRKLIRKKISPSDVVIGISASGVTRFVKGALIEARKHGAATVLIAANGAPQLRAQADIVIAPQTGAEVIAGSTRLKAGTAAKLVLNRITVASMVQLGKVYGNRMVDLRPRSAKLKARGKRILRELTGASEKKAARILRGARGHVKTAALMALRNWPYPKARAVLKKSNGFLRKALLQDVMASPAGAKQSQKRDCFGCLRQPRNDE